MSRKLQRAIQEGRVRPGWKLSDYLREAINDMGWVVCPIWGEKGTFKSNLLLQFGYAIYGDYANKGNQDYAGWDKVLSHIFLTREEFANILESTNERIPWIGGDDIYVTLPSSLYWTNKDLYEEMRKNWDAFRTNLGVMMCTVPNKNSLIKFLLNDVNFDVNTRKVNKFVGKFTYQRWHWETNYKDRYRLNDVTVEPGEGTINTKFVPFQVFEKYWGRRIALADKGKLRLISALRGEDGKGKNGVEKVGKPPSLNERIKAMREKGLKASQEYFLEFLTNDPATDWVKKYYREERKEEP